MSDIVYPASIKENRDKLTALYSIYEQYRLEHNKQGEVALSDWPKYQKAWYEYAGRPYHRGSNIFMRKAFPILREIATIKDSIRREHYPDPEWRKLNRELVEADQINLVNSLYGNRQDEKLELTKAKSPALEELKTVKLDKLDAVIPPDPLEDWTTYTEVDPGPYSQARERYNNQLR